MIRSALLLAAAFFFLTGAAARAADAFTPDQKTELNKMMHDYILNNPEVLVEGLNNYQRNQIAASHKTYDQNYPKYKDFLTSADTPVGGNPNGKHVVVEFFDYNCGYCKKAADDVVAMVKDDPEFKIYFKDMPILASTSGDAAKWAMAAGKQGKYYEFHVALMHSTMQRNDATFRQLGQQLGLDVAKLEKDAKNDPSFQKAINQNLTAARALGIEGTPGFVIGGKLFDGYMGLPGMKKAVDGAYGGAAATGDAAK